MKGRVCRAKCRAATAAAIILPAFLLVAGTSALAAPCENPQWARGLFAAAEGVNATVYALAIYDDGSGRALYAGGEFTTAGGVSANHVAKWDGTSWSPLGSGVDAPITELAVFDDGSGPALCAAGSFTTAGDVSANHIGRWDGRSWSPLGSGTNKSVSALAAYDDGRGPALYAGGSFTTAGGGVSGYIARWGCEDSAASIESAKSSADSRLVELTGQAATAAFGSVFYIEKKDRSSGIRVAMPGHSIQPSQEISVTGRTQTSPSGERYIEAWSAVPLGQTDVGPLGLALRSLGGGDWFYDAIAGTGQQGVLGGFGLNNIGLLVRVAGRVVSSGTNYFMMDDGSGVQVKCLLPVGVALDPGWTFVAVTGISSCERVGSDLHRLIRVRSQSDIIGY